MSLPIGTCSAFFYIYLPDLICTVYLYCIYFPVHILVHWKFSVYLWEIFIAQTYDWKFSVYLWEIFIAQKYELEIFRLQYLFIAKKYELEKKHE